LVRPLPILLPSHGGPNSVLAARLLDLAWPDEAEAVVLSVGGDAPEADVQRVAQAFTRRVARRERVRGGDRLGAILDHAALGYGVIALGATDAVVAGRLVSPLVDELLSASGLPVVMVRRGAGDADPDDPALSIRRILVPAVGTQPGRAAQEMAFGLAAGLGAEVVIAHVVTAPTPAQEVALPSWLQDRFAGAPGAAPDAGRIAVAERVVDEARALAAEFGAHARAEIRTGLFAPDVLLALARDEQVDLIVLAANLRQLSGRPFLGHGVEYLLEKSECAVAVVTAPPGFAR
ncbi:MAG TPA: universal stress protein, partial [Myxococcota bacterium]|nr:universal stress protein [Myxococcota bacterium]